jgi:hypothetical protein
VSVGSQGMSRDRRPHVAQCTWRSGALHVWGWDGHTPASTAWLYGGFGRSSWTGSDNDWHDTPVSYGALARLDLELPGGGRRSVPTVKLDPYGAAVWLSETPGRDVLSASVEWFAHVTRLAVRLVGGGHLLPMVRDEGPFTVARWEPALDHQLERHVEQLAAAAPPVCRNGSSATVPDILRTLVDGVARAQLHHVGWRPELGRRRQSHVQATRIVFNALAGADPVVRGGTDDFESAVGELARRLDRHARRVAGEPVVRQRVRLTIPADAHDPWTIGLELVDDTDPGRWCTAADVWAGSPAAVEVAGHEQHLAVLTDAVTELVDELVRHVDVLVPLAEIDQPTGLELDVEHADAFLDVAPFELQRLGIDLIGPEHLVRAHVAVRGRATPAPADDRTARFSAEALVQWDATVDQTEISDAELERVAAAGATLLHTGHRWVRIDPTGLRRARAVLSEHREQHAVVGAAALIGLAAGESGELDTLDISAAGDHDRGEQDGSDGSEGGGDDGSDWVVALLAGLPDERLEEARESEAFTGELRHYQRRGLAWMRFLARLGLGGCLADDMGLGKTATTLAHLVDRPGPHLVVCPLSVVHNWEAEARRFTPSLQVSVHHGSSRHRSTDSADRADVISPLVPADVVITTYGLLARDTALADVEWSTMVLDEAQMVKNPDTKAAKAVRRVRAAQKLALTGTPVENRLVELWALLDAVNPGLLGSRQRFRERYGMPIERHGDTEAAERLRRLTGPFVLRRTKADRRLIPDLPDKIEQIAFAQMTREQAVLYQQVVEQLLRDADELEGMQRRGRVLAALTRLKQICNHPAHALRDGSRLGGRSGKLARFDELVAELLDVDERALVFTQFREMGDLLQRHIRERFGFEAPFLHGGVARGGRQAMVDGFQDHSAPPLLLVSLKAGGTGLNLTAASQVIHYDRWWNPAVEDQATDRAWRIGQHRTVNVHKLVCQGTVEERIGQVIDDKRALADAVVGSGEAWLSELSTDELRDLVVLDRAAPSVADRHRGEGVR